MPTRLPHCCICELRKEVRVACREVDGITTLELRKCPEKTYSQRVDAALQCSVAGVLLGLGGGGTRIKHCDIACDTGIEAGNTRRCDVDESVRLQSDVFREVDREGSDLPNWNRSRRVIRCGTFIDNVRVTQ